MTRAFKRIREQREGRVRGISTNGRGTTTPRSPRNRAINDNVVVGQCMGPPPAHLARVVVQKPFCTPIRSILTGLPACPLYQIGIRYWNFEEHLKRMDLKNAARRMQVELRNFENLKYGPLAPGFLPMAWEASLDVSHAQVRYAVSMIERTGRLYVVKANGADIRAARRWADKDPGKMPKPWYESSCSEAKNLYGQVGSIIKKSTKGGRRR